MAKKNKLSGVVPGRKPPLPPKRSLSDWFKGGGEMIVEGKNLPSQQPEPTEEEKRRRALEQGLADVELRSDIDPYMNDLARLGWDIATRGVNQDDPKRQRLAATIALKSLTDSNKLRTGNVGGRAYFPSISKKRPEDTAILEYVYEDQAGRPVEKDMSLLYLTGQAKDYPRGEDRLTLVHELGHLASMYLAQQGLVDIDSPIHPFNKHSARSRRYDLHEDLIRKISKQTRKKLTKKPSVVEALLDILSIKDFHSGPPIPSVAPTQHSKEKEWWADRRISDDVVEEAYDLARSSLRERGLPPEVKYKGLSSLGEK